MPNCDFYATPTDHRILLDWLFGEETCDVYELASDFEQPLKRFRTTDEVLSEISSFSARLNRQIKKQSVAKIRSRPVLPGALALWDAGVALGPYTPGDTAMKRNKP